MVSYRGKTSKLESYLTEIHDPALLRLMSKLNGQVYKLHSIGRGLESSDASAMRAASEIRDNISNISDKLERYYQKKLLEKILNEVSKETGFLYNDAFNLKNYQIKELEYEDSQAKYDRKKDKIIFKKSVIDSFGGELVMPLYFEPLEEDSDKSERDGEDEELHYRELVDKRFIKKLIVHEETHRQINKLDIEYAQPSMVSDDHDELFFHIFKMLGGEALDAYSMLEGVSARIEYKEFARELKAGKSKINDVVLINKISPDYKNYKYLMDGVERYNLAKGTRQLRILNQDGSLEVIKDGRRYGVDISIDFEACRARVNYTPKVASNPVIFF